jgi:uncharacterized protein YcbX
MIEVVSLHVYPVKSLRGFALSEAAVGDRGFEGDRRFMVVDDNGVFLTQRTHRRMALVDVAVVDGALRLDGPGMSSLRVPLRPTAGTLKEVRVFNDRVTALPAGAEAAAWLSRYLEQPCELVYMPDASMRPAGTGRVGFADAYPFLLTSTASLADLARRGADVPMIRFRPNLVIEGAPAFAEDGWRRIRIGAVRFAVVKPCARCTIPTIDPETAEAGVEPSRTLATFRRAGNDVLFGQNLIQLDTGVVRLGDPVVVEETA